MARGADPLLQALFELDALESDMGEALKSPEGLEALLELIAGGKK